MSEKTKYTGQHKAFGLKIRSEVPFMAQSDEASVEDVDVKLGSLPEKWLHDPRAKDGYVEVDDSNIWFVWEMLGVMRIHDGRLIELDPVPEAGNSMLRQAIQSAGLGLILHQRNALTLHASAVEVEGQVVAFVGYKGMGKSTTAASLLGQGFPLVTDDLLVLNMDNEDESVLAYPGIPRLRLWPDSVKASLGEDPEMLPRNSNTSSKRLREVADRFTKGPLPLAAIYVLDFQEEEADQLAISAVRPRDACVEMVRHSYALHYLGNRGASAGHLARSRQLTLRVPVRRLARIRNLDAIPEMVDAILKDISMLKQQPLDVAAQNL